MNWLYVAAVIVIVMYIGRRRSVSVEEGDDAEEDGVDKVDEVGNDLVAIKVENALPDNTEAEVHVSIQTVSDSEEEVHKETLKVPKKETKKRIPNEWHSIAWKK